VPAGWTWCVVAERVGLGPPPWRATTGRSAWHVRTGGVVVAWLVALVVVALVHPFVPASGWLLVHLLVLGAVSNAILIWTWHFAAALLRLPDADARTGQVPRLVLFNAGALLVVAGVVADRWPAVLAGGVLVVGTAAWHAAALLRRLRAALPARFGVTLRYYVVAGVALPLGVALGVAMARGGLADEVHAQALVAHTVLTMLGWVGLTVVGTLVTLWPTMLRTRVAADSESAAGTGLRLLVAGLAIAAAGSLVGVRPVAVAGLFLYVVGLLVVARPHLDEARRRAPVGFPEASVLAGAVWLVGSCAALAVGLATAGNWERAADRAGLVTAPLLVGFAAQVLVGSLAFLVPVVLGGGPSVLRATSREMRRAGPARLTATNAGLLVCVPQVPSLVRVLVSVVVLVALAASLPLLVRAVVVARRLSRPEPVGVGGSDGAAPPRRTRSAAVGLALVTVAALGGVALDPAAVGIGFSSAEGDVVATGRTTTVRVTVEGMRFVPDEVEVPAGDRLVVELENTGDDRHDLVLETGLRTPRLAPGESATLDAGVVGTDLEGWCSVAGHKQMGMLLHIRVVGGVTTPPDAAAVAGHHGDLGANHSEGPSAAEDLDLMADPGPGFQARDPRLPPVPPETVHRVTLPVREVEKEVAPGVTQTMWTFGGTAPGPTLRGKVGDVFEVTLVNEGSIGHSIDFHAGALAPDGPMRTIQPGESLTYRFTATRSGAWLYHCSTMPMSLHMANGMVGAVVIDPPDLPPVDREYLLVQSEMYLGPQGGMADADRLAAEAPDLVVFNGYANQYDHHPLVARVGERVRVWVVAAGPQRGSAFHVVGGQFDTVWTEGAYSLPPGTSGGAQVLGLAPAQGGFVELEFPEPGRYPFVTHAMVDAERGAHGVVRVDP
jgi:nitrite reductase (NO-forming)